MANRIMTARYSGTCGAQLCRAESRAITAGDSINYGGKGLVSHESCPPAATSGRPGATRYRRPGKHAWTSSGARMTSRYSRCEDAPCCGCCD